MSSEVFGVYVGHYYNQHQQEQMSRSLPTYHDTATTNETQGAMATTTVSSSSLGIAARPDDFVANASCLPHQPNSDARQEGCLQQNGVDSGTGLSTYLYNSSIQEAPACPQLQCGMDQDQTAADFINFEALMNVDDICALIEVDAI
ncbi:hypothetical protein ACFX2H_009107 [Malus domestica]